MRKHAKESDYEKMADLAAGSGYIEAIIKCATNGSFLFIGLGHS